MSVKHVDLLHSQIPELFQSRNLSPTWDDDLVIIPIDDPEIVPTSEARVVDSLALPKWDPESLNYLDLENFAAEPTTEMFETPSISSEILDALGGAHPGAPISRVDPTKMPPPDCFAFYLPFHYYHPTWWGVYLLLEGVQWLAHEIVRRAGGRVNMNSAICSARMFLYIPSQDRMLRHAPGNYA
jgi:hypothetical protein